MLRLAFLACLAAPAAPAARAEACEAIRLAPGAASEEVTGMLRPEEVACFAVALDEERRLRIQLLDGDNVAFGVDGQIEGQDDYAFRAGPGTHRIRVSQVVRSITPGYFTLGVSLGDGPSDPGGWRTEEGEGRAGGLAWIGDEGGPSFALNCAAPGPRVTMTYDGMGTAALARPDAEEATGWIEIEVGGDARRHPVSLTRYDGFDRYWEVVDGLSPPLLDDFAQGSTLRLLDAEGSSAGEVGLAGSARLREAIARQCGL